jgi:two-component system OmpR family sensor kinase
MSTKRAVSIAQPIFLLVIVAILLATAVTFAITFGGPPPRPRPVPEIDIVTALRGGQVDDLIVLPGQRPPRSGESSSYKHDAALALAFGAPVVGFYAEREVGQSEEVRGSFTVSGRTRDGWRTVRSPSQPLLTKWIVVTFGSMGFALVLLSICAWIITRRISRPLEHLAAAAQGARVGLPLAAPQAGSREVHKLAVALSNMHTRIGQHAEGRTTMLAAIAHDLGTPLSRLAFHIEGLPEVTRIRAATDVDEMRAMISAAIGYARDELVDGTTLRIDLGSLLDSLVEDTFAAGDDVTIIPGPRVVVVGDPAALRRLFANVIGNAVRYGDRARVAWVKLEGAVSVTVDDDGPGVDPERAERFFEPFVRGDPSRNRGTGGTGLGLAIVRAIASRHGGRVAFEPSEFGARLQIVLPC